MKQLFLCFLVLILLTGCMEIISKNELSIAIQYDSFSTTEAFAAAERHCKSLSKVAVATVPSGPGNDYVGIFECR